MLKNEIYRVAYGFHDKWSPFPQTPDDWLLAAKELGELAALHNDKLLDNFLFAIFDDLEREYKKCTQENN